MNWDQSEPVALAEPEQAVVPSPEIDRSAKTSAVVSDFYPGVDILRGVAALSVVVYHQIDRFGWTSFPSSNPFALWCRAGWIGMNLFFVISGLVITRSALGLWERRRDVYVREFLARRFARIVPLYYLTGLLFVVFVAPSMVEQPNFWTHVATHLTFVQTFSSRTIHSIDPPNWSLAVEMQFYLLVLVLVPFLGRARPWQVLAGAIGVRWIYRGALIVLDRRGIVPVADGMSWFAASQLPGMLDYFGCGIALAMVFHGDRNGRIRAFLHQTRWLWPIATAAGVFVALELQRPENALGDSGKMAVIARAILAATCLAAVVAACAVDDPWFLRLTKPLRYLGTISYGIYLWHWLPMAMFTPVFPGEPARAFAWTLASTLLLASLSWHFFEQPIAARLRRAS